MNSADRRAIVFESGDGLGDNIQFSVGGAEINVSIENPWAGSTDEGFGQTTYMSLKKDDAKKLAEWLIRACL